MFLTDSAVGLKEEDNLRHLVINLGSDVPRSRVVPFLTCKHPLDYCLAYADRAHQHGFESLVVLGGDKIVGPPRCVEHAWQLREADSASARRSWRSAAGPTRTSMPAAQVSHLLDDRVNAEFYLTQIVSHHSRGTSSASSTKRTAGASRCRACSASSTTGQRIRKTLAALQQFLPVPVEALTREFADGATADEVCARSIRALTDAGVRHFYISNLPLARAAATLHRVMSLARRTPQLRTSNSQRAWIEGAGLLSSTLELIVLVGKQHVEAGQRAVAAADVGLQLHLHVFGQVGRVDLLLERAQAVPQHHDLVKERLDRPALFLQRRRAGRRTSVPPRHFSAGDDRRDAGLLADDAAQQHLEVDVLGRPWVAPSFRVR